MPFEDVLHCLNHDLQVFGRWLIPPMHRSGSCLDDGVNKVVAIHCREVPALDHRLELQAKVRSVPDQLGHEHVQHGTNGSGSDSPRPGVHSCVDPAEKPLKVLRKLDRPLGGKLVPGRAVIDQRRRGEDQAEP